MLATVLVGALAMVTLMVAVVGGAVADQRRVESAADLGALAGASAAQRGQDGCAAARSVVARNRSRLVACAVAGDVVTVRAARATRPLLGLRFTLTSTARGGPVLAPVSQSAGSV